ncbi:nitric oxide synthase oxygenase [Streptomyces guryensis]|uniref:nitric oxide synthase oxygenase n=1 Tax=Streptomyces guryensis TaxID=2886947 RepID=UPI003558A344
MRGRPRGAGWSVSRAAPTRRRARSTAGTPPSTRSPGCAVGCSPAVRPPPHGAIRPRTNSCAPPPGSSPCTTPRNGSATPPAASRHTTQELAVGARGAWRNADPCMGRRHRHSLRVRDLREVRGADAVAEACAGHLREATRDGRIRASSSTAPPTSTVRRLSPGPAARQRPSPLRPGQIPHVWSRPLVIDC